MVRSIWWFPPVNRPYTKSDIHRFLAQPKWEPPRNMALHWACTCFVQRTTKDVQNCIYSFRVKVKDLKTSGNETESYIEGTCGVHNGYLSGWSSSWPETQIPRKKWRALSPNRGTIQPSMCPHLEQSFATPLSAGPEWGRPAWPQCTEMLREEGKKKERKLPNSFSKCTNHTGFIHCPNCKENQNSRSPLRPPLNGAVSIFFIVPLFLASYVCWLSIFLIFPYVSKIYLFPRKNLIWKLLSHKTYLP